MHAYTYLRSLGALRGAERNLLGHVLKVSGGRLSGASVAFEQIVAWILPDCLGWSDH